MTSRMRTDMRNVPLTTVFVLSVRYGVTMRLTVPSACGVLATLTLNSGSSEISP